MSETQLPAQPPRTIGGFQFSLRTLFLVFVVLASSLAVFGIWGLLVFSLTAGLALHVHHVESLKSLKAEALVVACLLFFVMLDSFSAEGLSHRINHSCPNNLKQIALALQEYHKVNGCFPPAYVADKNGKPIHSWRVLIAPYVDQLPLYAQYQFSQPWDGPQNKMMLAYHLPMFVCPSDPKNSAPRSSKTSYLAVVGPGAAWDGDKPKKLSDFGDEASSTIMVVEVLDSGIDWTEPRDLSLDALATPQGKPLSPSSTHGHRQDFFFIYDENPIFNVALADGQIMCVRCPVSPGELRKMLQIGGLSKERIDSMASYVENKRLNWPNIAALAVWLGSVALLLTRAVRSRKGKSQAALSSET